MPAGTAETELVGLYLAHRLALLGLSVLLLCVVIELVRREWLKERYALLWLGISMAGLVFGIFPRLIVYMARLFNLQYVSVLLALVCLFTLSIVLVFSIVISQLVERQRALTQDLALLAHSVAELERQRDQKTMD